MLRTIETIEAAGIALFIGVVIVAVTVSELGDLRGVARPACEATRGAWVKTGEECRPGRRGCHELHACQYRILDRIQEMP